MEELHWADRLDILVSSGLAGPLPPTTRPETTPVSWRPVSPLQPPSTSWKHGLTQPALPRSSFSLSPTKSAESQTLEPTICFFNPRCWSAHPASVSSLSAMKYSFHPPLLRPHLIIMSNLALLLSATSSKPSPLMSSFLRVSGDLADRNFLVKINYLVPRADLPADTLFDLIEVKRKNFYYEHPPI